MSSDDDDINVSTPAQDNPNKSQSKVWGQRIAVVCIVVASLGLLVCAGLLIQASFTHKPAFELLIYSSFKTAEVQLLGYFSFLFFAAGCLTLFIASNISKLIELISKKIGYISASIGTVLIFYSFWLFYTSYKLEQEWWGYFVIVTWGISYISLTFSELANAKQKLFSDMLKNIGLILIFMAVILRVLESIY